MPVQYLIRDEYLEIVLDGVFTTSQIFDKTLAALSDPGLKSPTKLLVNASKSETSPSVDEIEKRVEFFLSFKKHFSPGIAILAKPRALSFGIGRMFEAYFNSSEFQIEVFSKPSAVQAWLAESNTCPAEA